MQKKILSEIYLYTGAIKLPNGVHLDLNALKADIAAQILEEKNSIKFTRNLDILSTYIRDFFRLKSFRSTIEKLSFGSVYKSGESSLPLIGADLMDLKNSIESDLRSQNIELLSSLLESAKETIKEKSQKVYAHAKKNLG
jgi:hypothetical protein